MEKFTKISHGEIADAPPRQSSQRARQETYRRYILALEPGTAGRLDLEPAERPITVRARLRSAAAAANIKIQIQRRGSTMFFWLSDEQPAGFAVKIQDYIRTQRQQETGPPRWSRANSAQACREAHLADLASRERSESVRTIQGGAMESNRRKH